MYSGQFDGNAAFSGGGFMPSQATQSADPSYTTSKTRDAQALVPLTVKQINEALLASNDINNFVVDGVDVNNVTLIGLVFNKTERVTDVGFVLDDGTGRINVHRWVNDSYDTKEMEKIADGMYVRIYANLKGFQGKKQLMAFSVRPVTDFNELTYHYLECMYVHTYSTKLQATGVPADAQMMSSVNGTPIRGYQGTQQNQFPGQFSELKDVDQMVMEYLQQPACLAQEKGVHVKELMQRLNLPLDKIMGSIKALEVEGFVYSTVDDEHYKSTGNA
ncbi:replication protein A 32 kDa subunit B-like [Chenopodium quinoa]|uniref:replication protein A 32 kDa subunit B-like n=1 Tax=Chenopodium quinoa TaxID=63459 RepID=UPI000B76DF08|nr:replication protein A 32 kDa subunit B-like [Chenopodium quinoa]